MNRERELGGENAGERPREVRFVNYNIWSPRLNLLFDDNHYLSVRSGLLTEVKLFRESVYERDCLTDPTGGLSNNCDFDWKLECTIYFYADGELVRQLDCDLGSEPGSQSVKETEFPDFFHEAQTAGIVIKFRHIQGLGIKPLRDYQIPSEDTDVALVVGEKKFYVVKKTLFDGSFTEKNQSEVLLEDVSAETMTALLDVVEGHFYWPPCKADLVDVLKASQRFQLTTVTEKMEDWLRRYYAYGSQYEFGKKLLAYDYGMPRLAEYTEDYDFQYDEYEEQYQEWYDERDTYHHYHSNHEEDPIDLERRDRPFDLHNINE